MHPGILWPTCRPQDTAYFFRTEGCGGEDTLRRCRVRTIGNGRVEPFRVAIASERPIKVYDAEDCLMPPFERVLIDALRYGVHLGKGASQV